MALAGAARAQVAGLPVAAGGLPPGLTVEGQVGFPDEQEGERLGLTVGARLGRLGLAATVAQGAQEPDEVGLQGEWLVRRSVTDPFQLLAFAGVSARSDDWDTSRIPLGASVAFRVVLPYVTLAPWLAPRVQYADRRDADGAWEPALGGGLDVRLGAGLGVRAAYDIIFLDGRDERTFGLGLSWTFHPGS